MKTIVDQRIDSAKSFGQFKKSDTAKGQTLSSAAPYKFNSTKLLALRRAGIACRAYDPSVKVAGTSLLVPSELLIAAGYLPFNWEMFASLLASNSAVTNLANEGSVTSPRCSFINTLKGAWKKKMLPVPDIAVGSSAYCEGIGYMIEELTSEMGTHQFHLDIPLYNTHATVQSLADQLKDIYDQLCTLNGIAKEERLGRLRESFKNATTARTEYYRLLELRNNYAPLNLGLEPLHWHFQFMPLWGDESAGRYISGLADEVQEYIQNSHPKKLHSGIPVGMFGLIPYGKTNMWETLLNQDAFTAFEGVNYIGEMPVPNPALVLNWKSEDIFDYIAENLIETPIRGGNMQQKADQFMHTAQIAGSKGMIILSHEHCQMLCPRINLLENEANNNGMDAVTISGDCILGVPPGPANIRLGTFLSGLQSRQKPKHTDIEITFINEPEPKQRSSVRLGIDFGSGYSKFILIDGDHKIIDKGLLNSGIDYPSLLKQIKEKLNTEHNYGIAVSGVGGDNPMFSDLANSQTTEINALINTVRNLFPQEENFLVIDIGTQDVKILYFEDMQSVPWINTNKSCGAGTGLVLAQILERWKKSRPEMDFKHLDDLASEVDEAEVINTTCGIFAVTSVVSALIQSDETRRKKILRGVYEYIAAQALKLLPRTYNNNGRLFLTGGIASHNTLREIFIEKGFNLVELPEGMHPQFLVAYGTALSI